ncbi:helix-turn-helix transcriptional regulator [Streptomyces sp. NPDC093109]|uniref:helix-turn-helix transcriptional regulator n=1 Tax=Streptomyces sp. NPDC093109 TaxID=3154977 RepID=UPI00344EC089
MNPASPRGLERLSPTERKVARIAIKGLSNPEIRDVLNAKRPPEFRIGTRTVGNHLGRIYGKLGIRGRQELVAFFDALDPADNVSPEPESPAPTGDLRKLNPVQRRIGRLAARNLSADEILDTYNADVDRKISIRIVRNQMEIIYNKLGIGGPSELAPFFGTPDGPLEGSAPGGASEPGAQAMDWDPLEPLEPPELRASQGQTAPRERSSHVFPLTPAEKRVARLAAERLTNTRIRDIINADRPDDRKISAQTVKSQLHTVYQKLGVHSRQELNNFPDILGGPDE